MKRHNRNYGKLRCELVMLCQRPEFTREVQVPAHVQNKIDANHKQQAAVGKSLVEVAGFEGGECASIAPTTHPHGPDERPCETPTKRKAATSP